MEHYIKSNWLKRKIKLQNSFEKFMFYCLMKGQTMKDHASVLAQAEASLAASAQHESDGAYLRSADPLVSQGWELKKKIEAQFLNLYAGQPNHRILIQVPPAVHSPAGYSLFSNLIESLNFIGVPAKALGWNESTMDALNAFQPTIFLTSDHISYLERLDWQSIINYRKNSTLHVGLTASLEEYDNSPLRVRLHWAKDHGVDFYYTFRDDVYIGSRAEYSPFFQAGYKILSIPFGANILHYYPVAGFERDLDFVLMASRKTDHIQYMKNIVRKYHGFIDGPGWIHVKNFNFNRSRDRYIYARTKIGLNVHLPEQRDWACELNERTYQLAVCGVPQLIDHPKLIDKMFSPQAMFVADSPDQYDHLFKQMVSRSDLAIERALLAQKEAFEKHTTFHRAYAFVQQLAGL